MVNLVERIFLEASSASAWGTGFLGAGHLYLVLRKIDLDLDPEQQNQAWSNDRVIRGGSAQKLLMPIATPLIASEGLLEDFDDHYVTGETPATRNSPPDQNQFPSKR